MPDSEDKITTPVELSGAKQLAEQLEKEIGKTKALGKDFSDLQNQLESTQTAIAGADKSALEGEQSFKLFGKGADEAHAAIHGLAEAVPGLGRIVRFMANGFTASIGMIVLAFTKFQNAMKATMESEQRRQAQPAHAIEQECRKAPSLTSAAAVAASEAENAKKEYEENLSETTETQGRIKNLKIGIGAEQSKAGALESDHNEAAEINAGLISPQDITDQAQASQTPAGEITPALREARNEIHQLRAALGGGAFDTGELKGLLNELIGLSHDIYASAAQKHDVDDLARQIRDLQRRVDANRY